MKTLREQLAEVKRELGKRRYFYPQWERERKIKPDVAKHQLEAMEAVAETLEKMLHLEEASSDLFKRAELAEQRNNVAEAVAFGKGLGT